MPLPEMKLHIGGKERREGWTVLDIAPDAHVDMIGNCNDLSALPDASCAEIYASHVLEHLGYDGELQATLRGFYRVMAPGGRLRVSVPDMETLCRLFLMPNMNFQHRYQVMRTLFGGRTNVHDVHQAGLFYEFLGAMIHAAGFRDIQRMGEFGEFKDASSLKCGDVLVSLNIQALK